MLELQSLVGLGSNSSDSLLMKVESFLSCIFEVPSHTPSLLNISGTIFLMTDIFPHLTASVLDTWVVMSTQSSHSTQNSSPPVLPIPHATIWRLLLQSTCPQSCLKKDKKNDQVCFRKHKQMFFSIC